MRAVRRGAEQYLHALRPSVGGDLCGDLPYMEQRLHYAEQIGKHAVEAALVLFGVDDHVHVKAHAAHVDERRIVRKPHIDGRGPALEQSARRLLGVVRHADGLGEIVARAEGQYAHHGVLPGVQRGGYLVHRPVAADGDDAALALGIRPLRKLGGLALMLGVNAGVIDALAFEQRLHLIELFIDSAAAGNGVDYEIRSHYDNCPPRHSFPI